MQRRMPFRYASPSYRAGVLGGEFDRVNLLAGESCELVSGIESVMYYPHSG
jgi:hypothetical protein